MSEHSHFRRAMSFFERNRRERFAGGTQAAQRPIRQQTVDGRRTPTEIQAMLHYAVVFLIIALIAGAFGFFGVAGAATQIAQVLFFLFLILFVASLLMGRRTTPV